MAQHRACSRGVRGRGDGDEVTALAFGMVARRIVFPDSLAARFVEGRCGPLAAAEELLATAGILKD
jgi:hypothetical protein